MATVDENNNEVPTTRRIASVKKSLVVLLCLGFIGSVAAIGVVKSNSGSNRNSAALEKEWEPYLVQLSDLQMEKLRKIRELSPFSVPADVDLAADVCYTIECLDSALNFLQAINFTADPCEDFFEFSCGRWLAENPLPSTSNRWSQFNFLRVEVNNITQRILESPVNATGDFKPVQQVKQFYNLCIDEAALEAAGLQPVVGQLTTLGSWPAVTNNWNASYFNLSNSLAEIRRVFQDSIIFRPYVSQDIKNTTISRIYLDQPGFFLSRSVLLSNSTSAEERKAAYKAYFVSVAQELAKTTGSNQNVTYLGVQADEVIAFETELARISAIDEDRTNTTRVYNIKELSAWQSESGADGAANPHAKINWVSYLTQLFSTSGVSLNSTESIIVLELDYLKNAIKLLDNTPLRVIANYVHWRTVSGLIRETTQAMRDIAFEFDKVNSGLTEQSSRKTSCAGTALNGFGMAIGVPYIKEAFDLEAKTNVDTMVVNLRSAFLELLAANDWMDNATKGLSGEKLNAINSFMAFPDWLNNQTRLEQEFAGLELDSSYLGSVIFLSQWMGDQSLKTLRDITDKDYWLTYPGVVNAFYSPEMNSITFPAGILQPPFYRSKGPESVNYGGIGVVIGHEVTHGFDDQGSQYDKNGNAEEWWEPEIREKFLEKAQCIVDQYGAFDTSQGKVNGDLTSGENIADNGGVRQSYLAYQNWIKNNNGGQEEKRLPGLEVYTPDQLFFLGYANIWCENINDAGLANQLATDPHSPAHFRVLGPLRNSEIFADKWECPVGTGMNPAGYEKCVLW